MCVCVCVCVCLRVCVRACVSACVSACKLAVFTVCACVCLSVCLCADVRLCLSVCLPASLCCAVNGKNSSTNRFHFHGHIYNHGCVRQSLPDSLFLFGIVMPYTKSTISSYHQNYHSLTPAKSDSHISSSSSQCIGTNYSLHSMNSCLVAQRMDHAVPTQLCGRSFGTHTGNSPLP